MKVPAHRYARRQLRWVTWGMLAVAMGCTSASDDEPSPTFIVPCEGPRQAAAERPDRPTASRDEPLPTVAASLLDEGELFAAASDGTLLTSTDGGVTWARLLPAGVCHRPVTAVGRGSRRDGTVCVTTRPAAGGAPHTFCSADGGGQWGPLPMPTRKDRILLRAPWAVTLLHREGLPVRIFRLVQDILPGGGLPMARKGDPGPQSDVASTDDLGASWHLYPPLLCFDIDVRLAHQGVLMSVGCCDRTTYWCDADLVCDDSMPPKHPTIVVNPYRPNERLSRAFYGGGDVAYECGDMPPVSVDIDPVDDNDFAFIDARAPHGTLVAFDRGRGPSAETTSVRVSTDGGRGWQAAGTLPGPDCDVAALTAATLFARCANRVFRSADLGAHWEKVFLPGGGVPGKASAD